MVIAPRPRCAALAQERYTKFPKEGRIELLRPYLIQMGLFPRRRNPESAPIRMQELRALVRKWNLNHKRNFWRENLTKDDVVETLNRHIRHTKVMINSIQSKKDEKRVTDSKRHVLHAPKCAGFLLALTPLKKRSSPESTSGMCLYRDDSALPNHNRRADSNSVENGIIYMSRWGQESVKTEQEIVKTIRSTSCDVESASLLEGPEGMRNTSSSNFETSDGGNIPKVQNYKDSGSTYIARVQQKCSLALLNTTMRDQMSKAFLDEDGLLPPLLEITHINQEEKVLLTGLACLINILSEKYKIIRLVEAGLVAVVRPLSGHDDERVQQFVAGILFAISSSPGLEEWLVKDGAIPAFNTLARSTNALTAQLAAGGLVNIAAILTTSQADSMQRVIVRTMTKLLAGGCDADCLHFCALALNNMTVLDNVRPYLDDQVAGVAVDILARLGSGSDDTIVLCAGALFNCLSMKQSRIRALDMNIVPQCQRLVGFCAASAQHSCTVLLAELCKYSDVANRLLDGGVVDIFARNLGASDQRSVAISAAGLSHLAMDQDNHRRVIESGDTLETLLRALIHHQPQEQYHFLRFLSSLVSNEDTQAEVVSSGVVQAIQDMENKDRHAAEISIILFNISCNTNNASSLLDGSSTIPTVVALAKEHGPFVKATCLKIIQNLSSNAAFHRQLLEGGVLEALESCKDVGSGEFDSQCAAVLYNFSLHEKSVTHMVDLGAIFIAKYLFNSNVLKVKHLSVATFCNMTIYKVITDESFLESLLLMSISTEAPLVLCCAKTLSNLSKYPRGRSFLGSNKNVVPALVAMMRSGVKDAAHVQYLSAICLCNVLSVFLHKETVLSLVEKGIIHDLIAITILRVEEVRTKETLAKAIFNLLAREDTRKLIADKDAVFALARLTRLRSSDINLTCVRVIYNLTCEMPQYETTLLEMEAERVLITQASFPNDGVDVKKMCGAALALMSSTRTSARVALAKKGTIGALRAVACVREKEILEHVATTAFNLSREDCCRPMLAAQDIMSVLVSLHEVGHNIVKSLCAAAVCNISSSPGAQEIISSRVTLAILVAIIRAGLLSVSSRLDALRAVVNLVTHYPPAREVAVEESTTAALCDILKAVVEEEDKLLVSKALRDMSSFNRGHPQMMKENVMSALVRLSKVENAEIKQDIATALCRLSTSVELAFDMVDENLSEALYWLTLEDLLGLTKSVFLRCSVTCRNVVLSDDALRRVSSESARFSKVLQRLSVSSEPDLLSNVAMVYLRITSMQESMLAFHKCGIVTHMLDLSRRADEDVKHICITGLNQVPPDMVELDESMVKMLTYLLTATESSAIGDTGNAIPEPSMHDLRPWSLQPASLTEHPINVRSCWITFVCQDFEVSPAKVEQSPLLPLKPGSVCESASKCKTPVGGRDVHCGKSDSADEKTTGTFIKIDFSISKGTGTYLDAKFSR